MNDQPSTKAIWALVLGVLSFSGCSCFAAIPAIVLGWGEKSGVGRAGWILGCASLAFHVLVVLAVLLILLLLAIDKHHY